MNNRKDPVSKQYKKWFDSKYPQPKFEKFIQGVGNANLIFDGALAVTDNITQMVNNRRKQSEFNRNLINDGLNPTPMYDATNNRGDYNINDGIFRPHMMIPPNKGQFSNSIYSNIQLAQFGGDIIPEALELPFEYSSSFPDVPQGGYHKDSYETDASTGNLISDEMSLPLDPYMFKVTSGFGPRKAPTKGASTNHAGVDLAIPEGSNIYSVKPGKVVTVNSNDKGGRQVMVQHPDGSISGYSHLKDWAVKEGDTVNAGQLIGYTGKTGMATGPHLHFTYRDASGNHVNPFQLIDFNIYEKGRKQKGGNDRGGQDMEISYTHNNPLNIHHGEFAEQYGGTKGSSDVGGHVSMFPSLGVGIQAAKDLLFGPKYSNLTISEARNKWVKGKPTIPSESSSNIVKSMGKDVRLNELNSRERDELIKQFAKWEGRQGYDLIKDMKLFAYGGEFDNDNELNTTTMKIKITAGPQIDNMEYGGQMGYGLDLNQRRVYSDMPEGYTDSVSNSMSEQDVPEDQYAIEAEGGETIYRPDGTHFMIQGDRHTQGGVKLTPEQAPEGSFVFSDTAKMRIGGDVLRMFGKTPGKKYTPAQLAKQYDVNKYVASIEDKFADPLKKKTGGMMVDNYNKKLAQLALVQEGKKGFRDGIPQIAMPYLQSIMGAMELMQPESEGQEMQVKYGGSLDKYQDLGEIKSKAKKYESRKDVEGWKLAGREGNRTYYTNTKMIKAGDPGTQGSDAVYGAAANAPGKGSRSFNAAFAEARRKKLPTFPWNGKVYNTNIYDPKKGAVLVKAAVSPRPATNPVYATDYGYVEDLVGSENPGTGTTQTPSGGKPGGGSEPKPGSPDYQNSSYPNPWTNADKFGLLASMMYPPKKYFSHIPEVNPYVPTPTFNDWRGMAATEQGVYNTAAQTMGSYGPTQGLGANLSFMAGQQAGRVADVIRAVNEQNVGVANQFSGINADIMNQFAQYDANRRRQLVVDNATMNQQYDNARKAQIKDIDANYKYGERNAMNLGAMNAASENYFIDPRTLRTVFRPGINPFSGASSGRSQQGMTQQEYLNAIQNLRNNTPGLSDTEYNNAMILKFPWLAKMRSQSANNMMSLPQMQSGYY
jgi:murein DD-endopeptidase MepM/ murein hydrolase activator NlpD